MARTRMVSKRNNESFVFGKAFLIRVEGQEMSGSHDSSGGDMEDVETAMATGQSVGGGEAGGFGEDVGEIAGVFDQSSARVIIFKLGGEDGGVSRRNGFPEFGESEGIEQLKVIEDGDVNRLGVPFAPRDRRSGCGYRFRRAKTGSWCRRRSPFACGIVDEIQRFLR